MSIPVRPIEQKDKQRWTQLWNAPEDSYLRFYESLDKVSDKTTEITWNRFFDPSEPVYSAVAELDGEVIGFANYLLHRSTWSESDFLYLNDLYVSEKARLGGAGRKLIEFVYTEADKYGCTKCYWTTASGNKRAQLLYDRVGQKFDRIQYIRK